MIRIKDIQERLKSVVGWEQSYNPQTEIDPTLTVTESGLVYQGAHPLLTLDNVRAIMPDDYEMKYPAWDEDTEYIEGDKIRNNETVFVAKEDVVGTEPIPGDMDISAPWIEYSLLSDYLEQETMKGIATTIQKFIREATLALRTKDVLLKENFYKAIKATKELPQTTGKSGFFIRSTRSAGVTTKVNRVSLQFSQPGTITLHVARDLEDAPERSIELEYTNTQGRAQWFNLDDLYLPGDGDWVLYYDHGANDIDMRALIGDSVGLEATAHLCGGKKFLDVTPIHQDQQSAGLNASVTIACDLTDLIIEQRGMFATVIQMQVATNLLRTMAMNPHAKINRNQSNVSKMDILYELDGNTQGYHKGGLGLELSNAYKALTLDVTGLDSYCLPCKRKGVRYVLA